MVGWSIVSREAMIEAIERTHGCPIDESGVVEVTNLTSPPKDTRANGYTIKPS